MKTIFLRYWRVMLTLAYGIVVFLFWYVGYPYVLSYTEQFQLFLFDADYLAEHLAYPGGVSVYVGEFLVQYFISFMAGAVIFAVMLMLVQRLTWVLVRRENEGAGHYALSFVPSVMLLALMGDDNVMIGYIVGTVIALSACWAYSFASRERGRFAAVVVVVPVIFYLASAASYMFVAYLIVRCLKREGLSIKSVAKASATAVYTVVIVIVFYYMTTFPLSTIAAGVGYYRYGTDDVMMCVLYWIVAIAMPFVIAEMQKRWRVGVSKKMASIELVAVAAIGVAMIVGAYQPMRYRVIRYDYLMRTHNWDAIVALAKKEKPESPIEMSAVNFALAMRGELGERMFEFEQHSQEGLLPLFCSESLSSIMSSEIFYRLGMVNVAQRLMFEAQEALPNGQKSGRVMRRLAETNIVNGHYEVAERYLRVLDKTYAYRKWAQSMRAYIGDEQKIETHPVYGELRRFRVTEDHYYNEREMDRMLALLLKHDGFNRLALDYLLAIELLKPDVDRFMHYVPLMARAGSYGHIPRAFQEALCYAWSLDHDDFNGMPFDVDMKVKQEFIEFVNRYDANAIQPKEGRYADTFWHFVLSSSKR